MCTISRVFDVYAESPSDLEGDNMDQAIIDAKPFEDMTIVSVVLIAHSKNVYTFLSIWEW